ncbi:MAG: protein kinase, partial [Proteobacteria bacterium]|nr:protein kinase [Pseudomonadota bacterium]
MSPDDPEQTHPGGTATVEDTGAATTRPADASGSPAGPLVLPAAGYIMGEVIGRGGMGEVITAHDRRIGRDVAIKRMRGDAPSAAAVARFLREARIQGRLDHPAIVPVHELAIDAEGHPFFTMKRLAGVTLGERMMKAGPQKPLLRAFVDVCLAIEFAHARGIVHRDLKP